MRVPMAALAGKDKLSVKCPDTKCGKMTVIRKNPKTVAESEAARRQREENQNYAD